MSDQPETVKERKAFMSYYLWVHKFIFLSTFLIVGFLLIITFKEFYRAQGNFYFPVSRDLKIKSEPPLNAPMYSDAEILTWFNLAMIDSFTFNYANMQMTSEEAKSNYFYDERIQLFDTLSQDQYQQILDQNIDILAIKKNKAVVRLMPTRAPVVENSGVLQGSYSWLLQLPCKVFYHRYNRVDAKEYIIKAYIHRVKQAKNSKGLVVSSIEFVNKANN